MSVSQQMDMDIQLARVSRNAEQSLRDAENWHGASIAMLNAALTELRRVDAENPLFIPQVEQRIRNAGHVAMQRHRNYQMVWNLTFNPEKIMQEVLSEHEAEKSAVIQALDAARPETKRAFFGLGKKQGRLLFGDGTTFKFTSVESAEAHRVRALQLARDAQLHDGEVSVRNLLHRSVQRLAAVAVTAVAFLGLGQGDAYAQAPLPVVAATITGLTTETYARPDDSTTGVTKATSANTAMQCGVGSVLSGGSCVSLSTLVPATCSYGQVYSGGSCVPLPTAPVITECGSGAVLSGGSCVPLPVYSATCAAQPDTVQSIPCSAGYTGATTQSRSGVCNSTTGYTWSMSSWSTVSSSCALLPVPVTAPVSTATCPTQPATSQVSTTQTCPVGQVGAITESRSGQCDASTGYSWSMSSWSTSSNTCAVPPPVACASNSSFTSNWGAGCTFTGPVPTTSVGTTFMLNNMAANYDGSSIMRCDAGPASWSVISGTCSPMYPPPPAPPQTFTNGIYDLKVSNVTATTADVQVQITAASQCHGGSCNSDYWFSPAVTLTKGIAKSFYDTGTLARIYTGNLWGNSRVRFDGTSVYVQDAVRFVGDPTMTSWNNLFYQQGVPGATNGPANGGGSFLDNFGGIGYHEFITTETNGCDGGCTSTWYTLIKVRDRPDSVFKIF